MKTINLTLNPDEARKLLGAIDFRHDALAEEWNLDDEALLDEAPEWVFDTIEFLAHVGDVLEEAINKAGE
jgi:hypothetical protein